MALPHMELFDYDAKKITISPTYQARFRNCVSMEISLIAQFHVCFAFPDVTTEAAARDAARSGRPPVSQ